MKNYFINNSELLMLFYTYRATKQTERKDG